uniref:Uncharacterized protein n=1 Tax=Phasianus colchicus TaxID=9054 RepID=A0A669Q0T1_PHACC
MSVCNFHRLKVKLKRKNKKQSGKQKSPNKAMPATHKFQHVPVKHIVIGEALSVRVVRFVIKTKRTAEVQVCGKFSCNKRKPVFLFQLHIFLWFRIIKKNKTQNLPNIRMLK